MFKMSRGRICLCISLFLSALYFCFPLYTVDLSGFYYFSRNKTTSTIDDLIRLADEGDARAQQMLAYKYDNGIGVPEDPYKSFRLCTLSAEQGYVKAQNSLGVHYQNGRGVAKDDEAAIYWYEKAADRGHKLAQANLASLLYQREQFEDSFSRYSMSAQQGDVRSQNMLCYMYENGVGVESDPVQAVSWCEKSRNKGSAWALDRLGFFYKDGRGVEQNYQKSFEFYKKAANLGHAGAQYSTANRYLKLEGMHHVVGVDGRYYKEAGYWYRKAAEQEYEMAVEYLAKVKKSCISHYALSQNQIDYCFIAAGAGNADAQNILSFLYHKGQGLPQDNVEALAWSLVHGNKKYLEDPKNPVFIRSYVVMLTLLRNLSHDEITQAKIKAREYREKYSLYE